jgi:osmoprotectant transport system substrate-binding protein
LQAGDDERPEEVYETVKNAYAEQFDIVWLTPPPDNDQRGVSFATRAAEEFGI